VKKAYNLETGEAVAVKIINKRKLWTSPQTEEATRREVEILKRLNHPNIIRYIDIYDCPQNLYIVLELYGILFTNLFTKVSNFIFIELREENCLTEL